MKNELVKKFLSECDFDVLRKEATSGIEEAKMNDWEENGYYSAYVGDIASGAYGQYQDEAVAEYFGITFDENNKENLWEEIEHVSDLIAEELTVISGLRGNFYFGHLEADGSYGLFYVEEKIVA